ncbi:141_t:CDS:1, partial [Acaulospora morrowiae]
TSERCVSWIKDLFSLKHEKMEIFDNARQSYGTDMDCIVVQLPSQ